MFINIKINEFFVNTHFTDSNQHKNFRCSVPNHFNIDLHRIKFVRFQMAGDTSVSAFPDGDNLFSWKGTIHGAKDTVR